MKKIIKINEEELNNIIQKIILEQKNNLSTKLNTQNNPSDFLGKGGQFERSIKLTPFENYRCVPKQTIPFVMYMIHNKDRFLSQLNVDENILLLFIKATIGIMGRETYWGQITTKTDTAVEMYYKVGQKYIPYVFSFLYKIVSGKNKNFSLGPMQYTEKTWNAYNLNKLVGPMQNTLNFTAQSIGTIYRLNKDYKLALSKGLKAEPSVNPIAIRQKKITTINGTGNNALDLAIVTHNMPNLINNWCETNDQNYAAPCSKSTYQPFPTTNPKIILNVYKNKPIKNYFPNKGSGKLTSIGYIEEVAKYMNMFKCIKF